MTQQQKRTATIGTIALVLILLAAIAYFKWIKPAMDKKREEKRKLETDMVQKAQITPPANTGINPAAAPTQPVLTPIGGGGETNFGGDLSRVITPPPIATNPSPIGIGGSQTVAPIANPINPNPYPVVIGGGTEPVAQNTDTLQNPDPTGSR